jgi:hypothetical protein
MAEEEWIFKSGVLDIIRRHHPELSDEELRQMFEANSDPVEPPETLRERLRVHYPFKDTPAPLSTVKPPSGGWPIRARWTNYSKTPEYFVDVEKLSSAIDRSTPKSASKITPKQTKRLAVANQKRELIPRYQEESRKRGRLLKDAEVWELAKQWYPGKVRSRIARQAAHEAKVMADRPGPQHKITKLGC